jgi:3-oxoacyl-[acyl-carrier protein] reductase
MNRPVALVTGGRRGIGFGIAMCLAKENYNLVICGMRPASAVTDAVAGLRKLGIEVLYCQTDVASPSDRKKMLSTIKRRFGRLDVLVNNAGIAPKVRADVLEATEESFDQLIKTNLKGPYFLTQAAAKWMIEQQKANARFTGCIINISSVSSTVASTNRGDYCISKAGISMATKLWAARLAEYKIPVFEIQPGLIQTDMTEAVTAKYDKLIAGGLVLQGRWGLPDDVGRAAAMLVRGDMPYSTGQVLMVDGGLTIQRL